MRKNSIQGTDAFFSAPTSEKVGIEYQGPYEKTIPLDEAVDVIMLAADARINKLYYHSWAFIGAYLRPFFPDYVDKRMSLASRLWTKIINLN